ncbi:DUF11 domain-containing protein [Candidatus Saccharibacteria bacterium]|nr:DUF11 domain-containing protein [Candidatus Saccharibacteria bacterium]
MRNIYKAILSVSAAAVVATATLSPVIVNAWGDSNNGRPSYTLDQINNGELGDTITFNSISNGKIGDEKNFVGAKVAGANVSTWNANTINVKDGETYTIRLFVHNNSPKGMDAIAKGVKATFSIPTTVAKSQTIIGYIDSSNATPKRYWDEVTLNASENIYLEYVDGSAKFNNNKGDFKLPNEVITSGATLGYTSMNGEIPGCYEYSGVVTIDVKVHSSVAAKVSKQVRIKGTKDWSESVEAKVGDEVEYQIEYVNLLSEEVKDVMIRDVLPTNVEYVADSTYLYNSNYQNGVLLKDNTVATSGINIGSYKAKGNAYVRFTGKVVDKTMACGSNQLVNWASATVSGSNIKNAVYKDDASVIVNKDDETCREKPVNPTPTPDEPGKPTETPTTIVSTGPETIVTGAIGAGSVITTLGYYIASRKKLNR